MLCEYFAHSGRARDRSDWQTLAEHSEETARRAREAGAAVGLPLCAGLAAAFHDFGKYDPAFQRRLSGDKAAVDHSTAGAHLLLGRAGAMPHAAQILAYAILGHHAGLPDKIGSEAAMDARIGQFALRDPIAPAVAAAQQVDLAPLMPELMAKMRMEDKTRRDFDASVAGRMIFSCLVDADYKDTEAFYDKLEGRRHDRDWPALAEILPDLRVRFETHMAGLPQDGELNPLHRDILAHIRNGAALSPGLFTLTVPTGGGKTLASLGFALDHAAAHGHRRILYAIPHPGRADRNVVDAAGAYAGAKAEPVVARCEMCLKDLSRKPSATHSRNAEATRIYPLSINCPIQGIEVKRSMLLSLRPVRQIPEDQAGAVPAAPHGNGAGAVAAGLAAQYHMSGIAVLRRAMKSPSASSSASSRGGA